MNATVTAIDGDWRAYAACRTADPVLFTGPDLFAETPEPRQEVFARIKQAKAVCAGCPVRQPCLDFAVANGEAGIWAGTTDGKRRELAAVIRPGVRLCRKGLHAMTGANLGDRGRCLTCRRRSQRKNDAATAELDIAS